MKVKDIINMFRFGQSFEIHGAYSGQTYYKSYLNSEKNLQKYLDKEVIDTPIYSDIRIKGSDPSHWCVAVIVIWIYDYDMCKQRRIEHDRDNTQAI